MLLFEDAGGECFDGVIFKNWHGALRDDWTTIERLVHEVNRTPAYLHAMRECLSLRVKPGKSRQQARMNVENLPSERLNKTR